MLNSSNVETIDKFDSDVKRENPVFIESLDSTHLLVTLRSGTVRLINTTSRNITTLITSSSSKVQVSTYVEESCRSNDQVLFSISIMRYDGEKATSHANRSLYRQVRSYISNKTLFVCYRLQVSFWARKNLDFTSFSE